MDEDQNAQRGTRFSTPVLHPEWLQGAIEAADRTFELALAHKLPQSIAGWMLTVACMRILRAVYGDDLSTVIALRRSVLEQAMPLTQEEIAQAESDLKESAT